MRIEHELKLDFDDVLLRPKRSMLKSKLDITLEREFTFRHSTHKWTGTPIIASPMDGTGTFSVAKVLQEYNMITAIKAGYELYEWEEQSKDIDFDYIAARVGTGAAFDSRALDYNNLKTLLCEYPIKIIVVDVANFYLQSSTDFLKILRDNYPNHIIFCGNVATADIAEQIIFDGADAVRVGIGPGAICTTRIKTGVGYPQISAINECSDIVHGIKGHVIADGGCTNPGDISKAMGAGADFVMLGSMLAAHDECEEEIIDGYVHFWGMSSKAARERHGGRKDGYQSTEGRVLKLPHKGPIKDTVEDILGGISSTMVYIGAERIKDIPKCSTFVRVNATHNRSLRKYDVDAQYD